jgi:hypothetical protein
MAAIFSISFRVGMRQLAGRSVNQLTRQAYPYSETQVWAADAILAAWRSGVRHKIRLANYAIGAVEGRKRPNGREILSFNPHAS